MGEKLPRVFNIAIVMLLVFQLTGCGTLMYPERRGQRGGSLDAGVAVLDGLGLLFGIIPGVIAFAIDFGNGTIYLPARPIVIEHTVQLRQIKFDPKHTSLAQVERIIKDQTGYDVRLTQGDGDVQLSWLKSKDDMMMHFAQVMPDMHSDRLALNS